MIITRFRSVWGIDSGDNLNNWANWFPDLKKQGYTGVEVDIHGLQNPDRDFKRLREICDQVDLEISAMVHSSWFQYLGPRPVGLTAENHLQNYRELLQLIEPLKPVNINFQSGEDAWDVEESIKFYRGTLKIDQALGVAGRVVHETHRNRSLFTPYATRKILEAVPQLRITADFSHWMVGLERLLDIGEGDRAMMDAIIPHVHHIHARIGTTQASQCPEPLNPVFKEERLCMERLWTRVLQTRFEQSDSDTEIRFVPEYGPFPYHPIGSIKTHSQVADEEGQRLQTYFTEFAASLKA
ncbi:hypothetical protein N7448_002291 [Penicillium atrosanguineum]|uniref:Xylose isomerase-like TIM barrel domain-containing protein n=1 Tax=Penicillium atrosanguineum TaxID=1132637 RepID=A0A9W9HDC6_9EURO|nr:uncharacterized protein N7443_005695 [Penicillium atrosanguineum]KAJ5128574.1 hypothetical protein N7526_006740 [Penicillium atrosanguineum]KAJ5144899.1 hypothetical protein N7448_002291 [Penicillium atrosanguineum]KAJ5300693.1 hypothetical protein N7443_005695 [Penicillium atrosanguineum]KAJ5311334.1 hypothetical protein N7476_007194 [Penicillium atrosanguineum]